MFLIKQGGGWEGEENGSSAEMCKRLHWHIFIKEERAQSSRNNEQGCVRACVSGWWALSRQLSGMQESLGATGSH